MKIRSSAGPSAVKVDTLVRVFAADVNEDDLFVLRRAVDSTGSAVLEDIALDGQQAVRILLERIAEKRPLPHLILLDLNMPICTGLEALKEIKSQPEMTDIPVVIFTSSSRLEDMRNSYRCGCNAYVVKPFEYNELTNQLNGMIHFWTGIAPALRL